MKRLFFLILVLTLFLSSSLLSFGKTSATEIDPVKEQKNIEKYKKEAEKQDRLTEKLTNTLKEQGLNEKDLLEEGSFYFTEDDKMIIQLKEKPKNKTKLEKMKKVTEKVKVKDEANFIVQNAAYSEDELKLLIQNFYKENSNVKFSEDISLSLDTINNRVNLTTNTLEEQDKIQLQEKYGDKLNIILDPSYKNDVVDLKARKSDWNKLGAGLGIKYRKAKGSAECSTAGVAKKNNRYFLITAGHCVGEVANNTPVYQWNKAVGTPHLDARSSDYDFGLILINKSELPGGRLASNGLYKKGSSTGYDSSLKDAGRAVLGQTVCKTGITLGYKCGKVTDTYKRQGIAGEITIEAKNNGKEYFVASGDSGGALINPNTNYLIGVLSKGKMQYRDKNGVVYSTVAYSAPFIDVSYKYSLSLYTSSTPTQIVR